MTAPSRAPGTFPPSPRTPRRPAAAWLAAAVSVAALAAVASPSHAAPPAPEPDYEALLAARAPAIVTVKLVVKSADWESTNDVLGTLVDPSGLVLTSSSAFGGGDVRVASVKVLLGSDPTENEAVLVARDGVLGLGYLQMLSPPGGKPLPAVDLGQGVEPKVGQSLFGVARHGAGFDYAPSLLRLYLTSRVETPRAMWNFAGDFGTEGLPVFDLEGRPAGVIARQSGSEGTDEHGSDTFVLPLKDVVRSLEQAKKRVPEALAKAKEAKEAKDEGGTKPAPPAEGGSKPPAAPPPAPTPKPEDPPRR